MKAKNWLLSWLIIVVSSLGFLGFCVYKIDPFFHYHKPELDKYYYTLDNQRSQNDGIIKHFDYDALISGTSMTENFRTTEVDKLFGCNSIKVSYSGGSYKEINDNIKNALKANKDLRLVIRCLDISNLLQPYDDMRTDLGKYPTYLYDDNPFNDVEYLLSRDVIFGRIYQMIMDKNKEGFKPGITAFDDYSRWQSKYVFGINTIRTDSLTVTEIEQIHLNDEEKEIIKKNIELNVTNVADEYPDVEFYYFYSPYSVVSWNEWRNGGALYKILEAEEYTTELIVPHKNIHLFSFNNRTDITTDLNNYHGSTHYASWINSLILKWMKDGQYRLTEDNYKDYLIREYDFCTTFDYSSLNSQEDYEADYYAAALLNKELTGVDPMDVLSNDKVEVIKDKGTTVIKFEVDLDDGYNYLCFDGQKLMDSGKLTAYVYDCCGNVVERTEVDYSDLDNEIHQYAIDLSTVKGKVTVILSGGDIDSSVNPYSNYRFSNVYMY